MKNCLQIGFVVVFWKPCQATSDTLRFSFWCFCWGEKWKSVYFPTMVFWDEICWLFWANLNFSLEDKPFYSTTNSFFFIYLFESFLSWAISNMGLEDKPFCSTTNFFSLICLRICFLELIQIWVWKPSRFVRQSFLFFFFICMCWEKFAFLSLI